MIFEADAIMDQVEALQSERDLLHQLYGGPHHSLSIADRLRELDARINSLEAVHARLMRLVRRKLERRYAAHHLNGTTRLRGTNR